MRDSAPSGAAPELGQEPEREGSPPFLENVCMCKYRKVIVSYPAGTPTKRTFECL